MAILKPKIKSEREQIRLSIDSQVLVEISHYCEYAGFRKQDEFFEEAALHILSKDKEFREWKDKLESSAAKA